MSQKSAMTLLTLSILLSPKLLNTSHALPFEPQPPTPTKVVDANGKLVGNISGTTGSIVDFFPAAPYIRGAAVSILVYINKNWVSLYVSREGFSSLPLISQPPQPTEKIAYADYLCRGARYRIEYDFKGATPLVSYGAFASSLPAPNGTIEYIDLTRPVTFSKTWYKRILNDHVYCETLATTSARYYPIATYTVSGFTAPFSLK